VSHGLYYTIWCNVVQVFSDLGKPSPAAEPSRPTFLEGQPATPESESSTGSSVTVGSRERGSRLGFLPGDYAQASTANERQAGVMRFLLPQ
jgi:hypothetical protein